VWGSTPILWTVLLPCGRTRHSIPIPKSSEVQWLQLRWLGWGGYINTIQVWIVEWLQFDPTDFSLVSISYKNLQFQFGLVFCGPVKSSRCCKRDEGKIKIKAITTSQIHFSSVAHYAPTRLAATDITQIHGPAPYLFALQVSDDKCPITPPRCLMACHHEPIQILFWRTPSPVIFMRLEPDSGHSKFSELSFRVRLMRCSMNEEVSEMSNQFRICYVHVVLFTQLVVVPWS
jgi:hypothetical protein